eukprot:5467277-Karenia_brevis.AAC.1
MMTKQLKSSNEAMKNNKRRCKPSPKQRSPARGAIEEGELSNSTTTPPPRAREGEGTEPGEGRQGRQQGEQGRKKS